MRKLVPTPAVRDECLRLQREDRDAAYEFVGVCKMLAVGEPSHLKMFFSNIRMDGPLFLHPQTVVLSHCFAQGDDLRLMTLCLHIEESETTLMELKFE